MDAITIIKNRLEQIFLDSISGGIKGKAIPFGYLSTKGKEFFEQITNSPLKPEITFCVNPSDLIHIYKNHYGINEKDCNNNIPLTIRDIRSIIDIVIQPDAIIYYGYSENGHRFTFLLEDGTGAYNLAEIYTSRRGNITAKTLYKTKKGVSQRVMALTEPQHFTSGTTEATLFDTNIPILFDLQKTMDTNKV